MTTLSTLRLPTDDGGLVTYDLADQAPAVFAAPGGPPRTRVAYAAAHVVADPLAANGPGAPAALDWEATLAFRRHLWRYGLGVADAMDTAQRGMGLDWAATRELIARSGAEARACGGLLCCGAGTDQLPPGAGDSLARVLEAYREQAEVVQDAGARVVVMASRALVAAARGPDDYHAVYGHLLGELSEPAILHWLGPMFDPALEGYWGSADLDEATETCLAIIAAHADEDRRHQGLPARRGARGRPAAPAARRRPALHRRRLQLPGADPRRRRAPQRRAARRLRRDRTGRGGRPLRAGRR